MTDGTGTEALGVPDARQAKSHLDLEAKLRSDGRERRHLPAMRGRTCGPLGAILRAPRYALSWKTLIPAATFVAGLSLAGRIPSPELAGWSVTLLLAAGGPILAAWISLYAVRRSARKSIRLRDLLRSLRGSLSTLCLALLFTVSVPVFCAAIACCGALSGRVPGIGPVLLILWAVSLGFACTLVAAAWLIIGLPSLLLQMPASVVEFPDAMEVASRCFSYVRNRPLLLLGALGASLAATVLATLAFAGFALVFAVLFDAVFVLGQGGALDDVAAGAMRTARWLFGPSGVFTLGWAASTGPARGNAVLELLLLGAIRSYFVAAAFASIAQVYLYLRLQVDGTPPDEIHDASPFVRNEEEAAAA